VEISPSDSCHAYHENARCCLKQAAGDQLLHSESAFTQFIVGIGNGTCSQDHNSSDRVESAVLCEMTSVVNIFAYDAPSLIVEAVIIRAFPQRLRISLPARSIESNMA